MGIRKWLFPLAALVIFAFSLYLYLQPSKPVVGQMQKAYPDAVLMQLPRVYTEGMPLERAITERRSVREYSDSSLTIDELSMLLFAAQGETTPEGFRSAPSAGALYPLETYVIANRVKNLSSGIYHYNVHKHALELVKKGDFREEAYEATFSQQHAKDAAAVFVFAAVENRTTQKYGERGKLYIYIEAGHASQNLLLEAVSLGLGAVPMGAFEDEKVNGVLGLDGTAEYAVYINAVGRKE